MKSLPALPLDAWMNSQHTLHLFLQIIGKIRMALHPETNHWWHVTRYTDVHDKAARYPGLPETLESVRRNSRFRLSY